MDRMPHGRRSLFGELKSVGMAAVVLPQTLVTPGSQTRLSNTFSK
jgi:hypothetical protein